MTCVEGNNVARARREQSGAHIFGPVANLPVACGLELFRDLPITVRRARR